MRKIISFLSLTAAALALSAALPQAASARDYDNRYDRGNSYDRRSLDRLPDGSYQQTCRDIRVDRDSMTARCRTNSGYYNYTSLSLRDCQGGYVENWDGNLMCRGGGYGDNRNDRYDRNDRGYGDDRREDRRNGWGDTYRDLPEGGYRDSCRDIQIDRGYLTAYCRDKDGGWSYSSLNLRGCQGGVVENKRGSLVCR